MYVYVLYYVFGSKVVVESHDAHVPLWVARHWFLFAMSGSQSEVGNKGSWQDDSYYQEELQLNLDEVNASAN